jgi:hypothetical protein
MVNNAYNLTALSNNEVDARPSHNQVSGMKYDVVNENIIN